LVKANGAREEVLALMRHTDSVAVVDDALRRSTPVCSRNTTYSNRARERRERRKFSETELAPTLQDA
jgi:hypothetical protein